MTNQDHFHAKKELTVGDKRHSYYSLKALQQQGHAIERLPFSIRVLLENAVRNYDGYVTTQEHIETILGWSPQPEDKEIPFMPARVLMQDFTGVPAIVDIASLRDEMARKGKDITRINPLIPVDLVIDHSVLVDYYGTNDAYRLNVEKEYERNSERYRFLKWAQTAVDNFSVVPPGMGICHQVNLEYFSTCVVQRDGFVFPDSCIGTDSHTPMVNGLGIVAYGVGGIEAEAAMLGQPQFFSLPEVIGLKLTGKLPVGATATDLVLTITELLRRTKVVGKFVEVFGDGLNTLSVPDRATIGNMSPEFGCTVTYFPIDEKTLDYLEKTNRPAEVIELTRKYTQENLLWRENEDAITYSQVVTLDLSTVEPTISGPSRPQDKILLRQTKQTVTEYIEKTYSRRYITFVDRPLNRWSGEGGNVDPSQVKTITPDSHPDIRTVEVTHDNQTFHLSDGAIVIAAITSCTNTSNPDVMIGAGLLAEKALARGLRVKPWVKTSLAPGSKVVTDYLREAGLLVKLEQMKFNVVGYGCTSCIGNSGPLPDPIAAAMQDHDLILGAALSSNRNFEARIHPQVKMNFLMSPLLVVAYAIAGRIDIDMTQEPLAYNDRNEPVYLKDIWPSDEEIHSTVARVVKKDSYKKNYAEIFDGNEQWQKLSAPQTKAYKWDPTSTYVKEAPFFVNLPETAEPIKPIVKGQALLVLGDSITTDHISPAGSFNEKSPAGQYLVSRGIPKDQFNSYGSRRGNDEVMIRGTFANVRIKNQLATKEGGFTQHIPSGEEMTVYDAAMKYKETNTPLLVLAGKEYGSGSSRDWAAKGTFLLGIRAVIAESYERIHRSNLVGMGVLPLQFLEGESYKQLGLTGRETFDIPELTDAIKPGQQLTITATAEDGSRKQFKVRCRLDSKIEIDYYRNKGILQYMLRQFLTTN
ncbi:aconitate hydratase AcnA [Parachryseolinea silvisoli]|uniref:aconitate hydratase AcnA n=1 Tax=Parachryseolinea silvisoli TaxID=2873601 RepID=UPI002265B9EC|nr:aconitate hydratase AcnA [Parachryseolinea silvisoli]MCD9017019.1 aconitate hydratase AcnA [Parachryseolinea silvisoli]